MKYTLITFRKDWADEFDAQGWTVKVASVSEAKQYVKDVYCGKSYYFGSNQGWDEDEIEFEDFEFKSVTEQQYKDLFEMFGNVRFGQFPW